MIIVPVYLWYFLIESPTIARSWGDYVPLHKSAFKDEVVSLLGEINGYLIAFFRGQLLVSMINGTATGIGLMIVGLDFGLLIGLLLCLLGLIPYLGIILCWVPAVIIASVQGGTGTWIPGDPWWVFPLVVTGIFTVVQQIDGLFITPKVVGESVGLHPMTVIVSVFVWTLLMGGLLGAILAVPLTATIKVLLIRYVWEKRILAEPRLTTEETAAIAQVTQSRRSPRPISCAANEPRAARIPRRARVRARSARVYRLWRDAHGRRAEESVHQHTHRKDRREKFTPGPEQQLSFGRKGLKNEEFAGEFLLQVHVKSENRTFDVPVHQKTYDAVRVGSTFTFQRPRSEQIK
jgi:hypothetical protein